MAFTQVTVVGSWSLPGRGPLQGEVELAPTAVMRNAGEVAPGGVVAPLVDGAISVTLTATNDAGTTPSSVLYRVIERIPLLSQPPTYSYYIAVPAGAGTIDLRTATRLQSIPAPERVTRDDLAVAIASIPGGGGGGAVSSVAGRTGTVTLTKTDVGLGSVDNTADTGKPVSAAQATALTAKLDKTSNLSDLASVSTARTNLGLSGAAVLAVGTSSGTVAAGDDTRITGASQKASNLSDLASPSTARTNLGLAAVAVSGSYADLTGDALPEFASSAQTAAIGTPTTMIRKITRFDTSGGAINQPLPAAVAGSVVAIGWEAGTAPVTYTATGADVIGSGAATSATVPVVGEIVTLHCTTAGRWRATDAFRPIGSLDTRFGRVATVTLTDAATVAIDATAGPRQRVVLAATGRVLGAPSGGLDGQILTLLVVQDTTGGRLWTLAGGYRVPSGITVTPTTTPNAVDRLVVQLDATAAKWDVLAYLPGAGVVPSQQPWQFRPEAYGAVGDDATDDTAAINACIAAAVAYATSHNYYAEILFSAKTYVCSSATTKGGAGQGNAQIPLPAVDTTGRKLTLVLRGTPGAETFAHFQQTVGQRGNASIRTTLTGLSSDATWGAPSVIGGPTAGTYSATNAFSNVRLVLDGVAVVAPYNPGIIAFDFAKLAQASVISAAAVADAGPAGSPSLYTIPTNGLGIGLRMPANTNNAVSDCVEYSCEGFYTGLVIGEHFTALRVLCVAVNTGILIPVPQGGILHGASITYACIEVAGTALATSGGSGGTGGIFPLFIGVMDVETVSTAAIVDTNNHLTGQVCWSSSSGSTAPVVTGAAKLKVLSLSGASNPGALTAPTVPATTVALANPFWRDCAVSIIGGTVTVVAVDGQTTGVTSGMVIVPSNKTITLTYSVAPTWTWTAL